MPLESITPDYLFEERREVSWCRPILQGDVFVGVELPGFEGSQTVQIITHPCSMRRGVPLNPRIQVVPVRPGQAVRDWSTNVRKMLLPDLCEDGRPYEAPFVELTSVAAGELTLDRRVASLTHSGIHVLQQRLVHFLSRLELPVSDFRAQSANVLAEAELQENWVEAQHSSIEPTAVSVEVSIIAFQRWLDEVPEPPEFARDSEIASLAFEEPATPVRPRDLLADEANHARLRRDVREAVRAIAMIDRGDTGS